MNGFFTANLGLKAVSVLLGVSLWYAVTREQATEFAVSIPLELRNLPEGLEVTDESVQQVDVRLRGPAEILRRLTPQDLSVGVDLEDAQPGERVAYLSPDDVTVPFGVRVNRVTPSSLRIELDETVKQTVNIIPRVLGSTAEGYELYNIELTPEQITVVGPSSRVRGLEQVTTEPVSAEGLRQSFSRTINLELDPLVRLERGATVELTLDVREVRLRKELTRVDVVTRPSGVRASINPESVSVLIEGPRSVVEQVQAEDLEAELRLDGLGKGSHRLGPIVRVHAPTALTTIHILSVKPPEIDVVIR